jgi:hypothetical protein
MQTKSAIILGVSFIVGIAFYALINDWSSAAGYERSAAAWNGKLTVSASKRVFVTEEKPFPPPEAFEEVFTEANKKAETLARVSGAKLSKPTDIYSDNPSYEYDLNGDGNKSVNVTISISYDLIK